MKKVVGREETPPYALAVARSPRRIRDSIRYVMAGDGGEGGIPPPSGSPADRRSPSSGSVSALRAPGERKGDRGRQDQNPGQQHGVFPHVGTSVRDTVPRVGFSRSAGGT